MGKGLYTISYEGRWNSYLKLMSENSYTADAADYLKAKKEKFKAIAKINKNNKKY